MEINSNHSTYGAAFRQKPIFFMSGKETVAFFEGKLKKNMTLQEITVDKKHKWNGKSLSHIPMPEGTLVVMVSRQKETMIPTGNTIVYEGDVLVLAKF